MNFICYKCKKVIDEAKIIQISVADRIAFEARDNFYCYHVSDHDIKSYICIKCYNGING